MTLVLAAACAVVLSLLSLLAAYQWLLAAASLLPSRRGARRPEPARRRFVVLVPAHDEESGLPGTLTSLRSLAYPADRVTVVVVADRCRDRTAAVARAAGVECLERQDGAPGKGAALAWAIDEWRRRDEPFDALVVLDADTLADPGLLSVFDDGLERGHAVQQAYNDLSNPWESPFTRIIAVTAVLRNRLFYGGKARLGLSAMLTGTGMCFSREVLDRHPWNAFSVGEDWEFSASLLLRGERIHFRPDARVRARESRGLRQASSQRLRWASGRHAVARSGGRALLSAGLRERRLALCDAALNLAAPTYAAQAALALLCLAAASVLGAEAGGPRLFAWALAVTGALGAYFLLGLALTGHPLRAMAGLALVPVFLPWRMAIEVMGLLGYGRRQWVRTARIPASR
jgi:cellulose synthase/poly-beta-1,6-N-acetylglucosamine synthase-like glycosyltransferase